MMSAKTPQNPTPKSKSNAESTHKINPEIRPKTNSKIHLENQQKIQPKNHWQGTKMPPKVVLVSSLLLSAIIITANYTVQFKIGSTPLTFGALTYPFSFLLLDVLSEKYGKQEVVKVLFLGLLIAFYPSYFASTPQIALASIIAFCVSQPLDVVIFYTLKTYAPRHWWLRNGGSTLSAQFIDTIVFFCVAFWAVQSVGESLQMALADYCIKAMVSLANTPIFYLLAIRAKRIWRNIT